MEYIKFLKCRICLIEDKNMKLIQNDSSIPDEIITIREIIMSCAAVEIEDDDRLPQNICNSCLQDAIIAYAFKRRCEQTDSLLKSQLNDQQININDQESKKYEHSSFEFKSLAEPVSIHEEAKSYLLCTKCPVKFTSQEELNNHILFGHKEKTNSPIHKCNFCSKQFCSETRLNRHIRTHAANTLRAMRRSTRKKAIPVKEDCYSSPECSDTNDHNELSDNEESEHKISLDVINGESRISTEDKNPIQIKNESEENNLSISPPPKNVLKYAVEKNENGEYECISCPETFTDAGDLRIHTRSHKHFNCKLCAKSFTVLSNLRRHLRLHVIKTEDSEQDTDEKSQFKCIACEKIFFKRKYLSEHLKTHKEFGCSICGVKFTFATNLRKHLRWHSTPKDEIKVWKPTPAEKRTCDICFKVFKYRPSMQKHRKKHEMPGKPCRYCEQVFENPFKLHKHMEENHENEKNIICSQCGKKFFREVNLKMHMIVHTGAKPYMCEICGASFALGGNLASHKRLHTGVKPYKCETCGRGFAQQAALRSHEASHSNRRDHVCPECGAAFSRAGAMRNHRKRHIQEAAKQFPCTMCGKRFTFSSERKRHMTIHTGEKNYVCDFCGKAFNRTTNLTVHRRIHTGELPHKCDVCGKGFIQAHCMKNHMNTHRRDSQVQIVDNSEQIVEPIENIATNVIIELL